MTLSRRVAAHILPALHAVLPTTAAAQTEHQSIAPPAAYSVGAAFDATRGMLIVFGGFTAGRYVGDTWEWDGSRWSKSARSSPSPRNAPALANDERRGRLVLFGGDARPTGDLGDTWERVGDEWRKLDVPGPPARSTHVMVYDSRRDRVVLFGGIASGNALGDTWEFDGSRWSRVAADGPSPRGLFAMAYDANRGKTVLFGGTRSPQPDSPPLGDTWEWDGSRWTNVKVSGPSARDHTQMVYDPVRRMIVLHGGGGDDEASETWTFDGRSWKPLSHTGPVRRYAKMVFDARSQSVLLYGGFAQQPSNELWQLEGAEWKRISP